MRTPVPFTISIADLTAAGLRLRPVEAVTIAREVLLRARRGDLPGIPSPTVLRFTSGGDIVCEGPVVAEPSVERVGRLLESLLPGFDAPPELRVPGALRRIVARALGTLDLPAYRTLDGLAEALNRFTAGDASTVVRGLVDTWRAAVDIAAMDAAPPVASADPDSLELTISDVRRARRATGLRLTDIAERSRIPVSLLRELEWGYFANWPGGHYGRTQLVRYARAAGLDEEVVTRAVWPALDEAVRARGAEPPQVVEGSVVEDANEDGALADVRFARYHSGLPAAVSEPKPRRPLWLAALAIPALIVIGLLPAAIDLARDAPAAEVPAAEVPAAEAPARSEAETATPVASGPSATSATAAESRQAPAAAVDALPYEPGPADLPADAAFSPAFASVGSAMFYHADAGDRSAIFRADTDTKGAVLRVTSIVDDEARNFHARPSPDGERIAFDSDRDGERAVYVADANGRNVRRISGLGFAAVPSWSPDGRTLAFVRAEAGRPRVWNLWTADLETGETRRLTSHRVGQPWGAAWFPDGRRIAYSHEERLVVRSLEDGRERVYPTPKKGHLVRTPAVSPDGRRIIFQVHRDGVWLLDLSDDSIRRVLADPTAEEFTWAPDGRRVAYHSRKAGGWGIWMPSGR